MTVVIHGDASDELALAADWYERRREGLGLDLLEEVSRALDAIAEQPEASPPARFDGRNVRHFLLVRFPFSVV